MHASHDHVFILPVSDSTGAIPQSATASDDPRSEVLVKLLDAGWDLNSVNSAASVFPDTTRITDHGKYTPVVQYSHATGPVPSWELNYPVLSFLMNGHYYSDYHATLGLMGLSVMSDTGWEKLVSWLGKYVEALANTSCEQLQVQQ